MLRIHAPFGARTHPMVTGLILTARRMQQRHTLVFENAPEASLARRGHGSTLKDLSGLISLSLENGPRIVSPSLVTAALAIDRWSPRSTDAPRRIEDQTLEALSLWESRAVAVTESFDELALAIAIQHYSGVMAANTALCAALETLDSQLAESVNSRANSSESADHGAAPTSSPSSSSSAVTAADAVTLPLMPVLEFLTSDARMPLSPYAHVAQMWPAPDEDMRRVRALVRASAAAHSQKVLGKSVVGDTDFTNVVPSSYAFIQKIQNGDKTELMRKKSPTLKDVAAREHGGFGASTAVPTGTSKRPPPIRRDP